MPNPAGTPAPALSLTDDIGFLLARCSAAAVRATNAALVGVGLRARHYALLQAAATPGGSSQRRLATDLGLDPSAVVALVDDLERTGLVARTPDPTDRRARVVVATSAGHHILRQAAPLVAEAVGGITADLADVDRAALLALLQRVVARLDQ
jgi:DNA-binding MarR family transcriptional regulator